MRWRHRYYDVIHCLTRRNGNCWNVTARSTSYQYLNTKGQSSYQHFNPHNRDTYYRIQDIIIFGISQKRRAKTEHCMYSIVNVVVGVGPYIAVAAKLLWKPSSLLYACCYLLAITNTCFQVINIQIFTDPSISGIRRHIYTYKMEEVQDSVLI